MICLTVKAANVVVTPKLGTLENFMPIGEPSCYSDLPCCHGNHLVPPVAAYKGEDGGVDHFDTRVGSFAFFLIASLDVRTHSLLL